MPPAYAGQCHNDDPVDRSLAKKPADFGNGDARRPDIIHDQDIPVGQLFTLTQAECFSDVLPPFLHRQAGLGASGLHTTKTPEHGDS